MDNSTSGPGNNNAGWIVVAIIFIILFGLMSGLNVYMHLARRRLMGEIRLINAKHMRLVQELQNARRTDWMQSAAGQSYI